MLSTFAVRSELVVGLLVPLQAQGFPLHLMWHAVWLNNRELPPSTQAFKEVLCSESWGQATPSAPLPGLFMEAHPERAGA